MAGKDLNSIKVVLQENKGTANRWSSESRGIQCLGKRQGLTLKQAFNYLLRYKGISFVERHYDYMHTQSFASAVDDMTEYCHKEEVSHEAL